MLTACDTCGSNPAAVKDGPMLMCLECARTYRKAQEATAGRADPVNRPEHYAGDVECIDAIRAALGDDGLRNFCLGNAMKYIWRADKKGGRDQDMAKALWYLRMASGDDPRKDRQ